MKSLFLTLALLCASSHAQAAELAAPSSDAVEAIDTTDDLPMPPEQAEPAFDSPSPPLLDTTPIPAVAVSIATEAATEAATGSGGRSGDRAAIGPAPGSLEFEMSTVSLLEDAVPVPEHESVAKR